MKLSIRSLIFLFLMSFVSLLYAEEVFVIHHKNGCKTTITLAKQPIIEFEGNNLTVNSENVSFSIPIEDVDFLNFQSEYTSVDFNKKEEGRYAMANGHIVFSQLKKGSSVNVFSIEGKRVSSYSVDNLGYADIDFTTLGKGIYIVKSSTICIKIINKN